jgi:hypothetical protein
MKVSQPDALGKKLIQKRGFDNRITMTGKITIPLIVGYHKDDVWLTA